MENQEGEIRIYVACLAAYNNGILHGCWIDAGQEPDDIRSGITAMLKASPIAGAEEYAIHDYEGFEGASLSEYQGIDSVAGLAAFIAEHGALGGKLVEYFGSLDDAREAIEDRYAGEYQSVADFAQELTEQSTQIPESLQYYIDWEHMARDLEINDILSIETGFRCIHVFWRQ
jgi:antirestriction protein